MGNVKVWNGSSFVTAKSVKVWNGSSWVNRKLHHWNGSEWVDDSTKVLTYSCNLSNTLCPGNFPGTKWRNQDEIRQGTYEQTSTYNHIGFMWFDVSQIVSDLAGKRISKVEAYLYRQASGITGSVPLHIWSQNMASSFSGSTSISSLSIGASYLSEENADVLSLARSAGGWCTISSKIGEKLRDGTSKGIALYVASPHYTNDYVDCDGYGDTNKPKIRITCY